jgi:hypothetical protein
VWIESLAARIDVQPTTGGVVGLADTTSSSGFGLRLAGRRLDAARIHQDPIHTA